MKTLADADLAAIERAASEAVGPTAAGVMCSSETMLTLVNAYRDRNRFERAISYIAHGSISPAIGFAGRVLAGATADNAYAAEVAEAKKRWDEG